ELGRPASDPAPRGPVFRMPQLTGSWARARQGLEHPVTGIERPGTFDDQVAADHDDVVLVHLGHRLVQQCLRLLRAEIWAVGPHSRLARVTARGRPRDGADLPARVASCPSTRRTSRPSSLMAGWWSPGRTGTGSTRRCSPPAGCCGRAALPGSTW